MSTERKVEDSDGGDDEGTDLLDSVAEVLDNTDDLGLDSPYARAQVTCLLDIAQSLRVIADTKDDLMEELKGFFTKAMQNPMVSAYMETMRPPPVVDPQEPPDWTKLAMTCNCGHDGVAHLLVDGLGPCKNGECLCEKFDPQFSLAGR